MRGLGLGAEGRPNRRLLWLIHICQEDLDEILCQ